MNLKKLNELEKSLDIDRKRFARAVLRKAKLAGLNPKNRINQLAIRKLADVEYELVMLLLDEKGNK